MNFFHEDENQKLIQLLKNSEQDFRFDQAGIKNRLILNFEQSKPNLTTPLQSWHLKLAKYTAVGLVPVVILSSTIAAAANSQPGDKLFPLNKFGEQLVLSLPLSAEQKANIQTHIVSNRLKALTEVQTVSVDEPSNENTTKEIETIKESDESLKDAIDTISASREQFQKKGQALNVKKLDASLTQLDNLAQEHEQRIQTIESMTKDSSQRNVIDQHLTEIKNARHKARVELNLDHESD